MSARIARRGTSRKTWLGTKTSTTTAIGRTFRSMAKYGCRTASWRDGSLIAMATGRGFHRGDGRGWTTHRGAKRRFTTDAGLWSVDIGDGRRDQLLLASGQFMRLRLLRGLVAARDLAWEWV